MVSRKGSQALGLDAMAGFSAGEPGGASVVEMADFSASLRGRPGFFTPTPASRR